MLAYQVCECSTSHPASGATIDRSTPSVCRAAFAPASSAGTGCAVASSARRAEAVHVDLGELAQRGNQVSDMDAGPAVDVRRVLRVSRPTRTRGP